MVKARAWWQAYEIRKRQNRERRQSASLWGNGVTKGVGGHTSFSAR